VTAGDTPADISRSYADATGHAPMMPEHGLGFWQCKLRYWNQEQLLEVAREHKRRGLPLDVIVADFNSSQRSARTSTPEHPERGRLPSGRAPS